MKTRRTFASIMITASLVIVLFAASLIFGSRVFIQDAVVSFLENTDFSSMDFEVSFSGINRGFLYKIQLTDASLKYKGQQIFSASLTDVSVGLIDAVNIYRGKLSSSDITLSVYGMEIRLDDNIRDFFPSDEKNAGEEKEGRSRLSSLPGIRLNIQDGSFHINYSGVSADIPSLKGSLFFDGGLKYKAADFSSDGASALINRDSEENLVTVSGLRVSGTREHTGLYVTEIVSSKYGTTGQLALTADFSDENGKINLVVNANNISSGFMGYNVSLLRFSAGAVLDSSTSEIDSTAYVYNFSVKDDNLTASAELASAKVFYSADGETSLDVSLTDFRYDDGDYEISSPDLSVSTDFKDLSRDIWFNASSTSVSVIPSDEVFTVSSLNLGNLFAAVSYSEDGNLSVNAESLVSGRSSSDLVQDFSGVLSGNLSFDLKGVKELFENQDYPLDELLGRINASYISLSSLKASSIGSDNSLYVYLNDENVFEIEFASSDELNLSLELDPLNRRTQFRFSLSDFAPERFRPLIEAFVPKISSYIGVNTRIDGSLSANLFSSEEESALPSGKVSLNAGVRDAQIGSGTSNLAVTLEAANDGKTIDVSTLAATAFGLRLSFSGTVDSENLFPQGSLILQNSSDGKELAGFVFERNGDNSYYSYRAYIATLETFEFVGKADRDLESLLIDADCVLRTAHEVMDLDVKIDPKVFSISVEGDYFNLYAGYDGGSAFNINGGLYDTKIYFSGDNYVTANAVLDGSFDLVTRGFTFSVNDVYIDVSDILNVGFDLSLTNSDFSMTDIQVGRRNVRYNFDGGIYFSYDSLADFLYFDTSDIKGTVNLYVPGTQNSIICSMISNRYYADVNLLVSDDTLITLNLLGSRGSGFYADASVGDLFFEARLKEKILRLFNLSGSIGSFDIETFDFVLDFNDRTLKGTSKLENVLDNIEGEVRQGGTVDIEAKIDSLAIGALSFAGFDVDLLFNMKIRDAYLGDGYDIPDTEFSVSYNSDRIAVTGDMITGNYTFSTGVFNLDISEDFLFSFNASGHLGEETDIHVSDINFPVGMLNQFLNTPFAHPLSGYLRGELLVKGDADDLSYYGLLSSQKMELDIFYFPDQIYTLSNFNVVIYDHDITVNTTPLTGHNTRTGKYFNGTLKLDVVLSDSGLENLECVIDTPSDMYFFFPAKIGDDSVLDAEGDVNGLITIWVRQGTFGIDLDINAHDFIFDFDLPEMPKWFYNYAIYCSINMNLRTGKNFEFYYPTIDNSFINFTLAENQNIGLNYDSVSKKIVLNGEMAFKTGRISYLNNDFIITEGSLGLVTSEDIYTTSSLKLDLDLRARLREYVNGERYEIYLVLQDADLENLSPRFESMPTLSENEIINILGQSIIPADATEMTASSIASVAVAATDAFRNLGLIESNENFSVARSIRESLGLDVFSIRSNILGNIIAQALPGESREGNTLSLVSRYLDGTSVYVGKYYRDIVFARMTLLLKAQNRNNLKETGHFLADDLNLDMEFSFDWENPIGIFSVFTRPEELSVFDILDTIGFSFAKRITF